MLAVTLFNAIFLIYSALLPYLQYMDLYKFLYYVGSVTAPWLVLEALRRLEALRKEDKRKND